MTEFWSASYRRKKADSGRTATSGAKRPLSGLEVGDVITSVIVKRLADAEMRRRRDWQQRLDSERAFVAETKPSATREPRLIRALCGA